MLWPTNSDKERVSQTVAERRRKGLRESDRERYGPCQTGSENSWGGQRRTERCTSLSLAVLFHPCLTLPTSVLVWLSQPFSVTLCPCLIDSLCPTLSLYCSLSLSDLPCPSSLATTFLAITSLLITRWCIFYIGKRVVPRGANNLGNIKYASYSYQ